MIIFGRAQSEIENSHKKIIELRKRKRDILELSDNVLQIVPKEVQVQIIEEKIKGQEENIKLWSGRLDPNRRKWLWSFVVPLLVSLVTTLLINYLI